MKIRNRTMSGQVSGVWVVPGDVIDVDADNAARYIKLGYAVPVDDEPVVETATVDEPAETAVPKPRRGRPPKAAAE